LANRRARGFPGKVVIVSLIGGVTGIMTGQTTGGLLLLGLAAGIVAVAVCQSRDEKLLPTWSDVREEFATGVRESPHFLRLILLVIAWQVAIVIFVVIAGFAAIHLGILLFSSGR
jgi:hypothetical protein